MKGQEWNNEPVRDDKLGEKPDDDIIPDDAQPLCLKCLTPCEPLQYYCSVCDSNDAINPLTPYIGFVNIRFNYGIFITMWRKIWYERDTSGIGRLFYLFMVAVFVPVFIIVGLPWLFVVKMRQPALRKTIIIALCIAAVALLISFWLWAVSTNTGLRPITVLR